MDIRVQMSRPRPHAIHSFWKLRQLTFGGGVPFYGMRPRTWAVAGQPLISHDYAFLFRKCQMHALYTCRTFLWQYWDQDEVQVSRTDSESEAHLLNIVHAGEELGPRCLMFSLIALSEIGDKPRSPVTVAAR